MSGYCSGCDHKPGVPVHSACSGLLRLELQRVPKHVGRDCAFCTFFLNTINTRAGGSHRHCTCLHKAA